MKRLFLIILSAGLVIWLIKPQLINKLTTNTRSLLQNKAKQQSRSVVISAVSSVNKYVREQSQAVLGEQIGLELLTQPEAEVVKDVPDKQLDNIILLDYLTVNDLKLELKPNQQYYFDLRNVPEGYCLYVNEESYLITSKEYLNLSFPNSGNFSLAFDKCDKKLQKFGEIIVE